MFLRTAVVLLCSWSCLALTLRSEANPIRKVVNILKDMQHEIEAEGEQEKKSFDKFMCYCDGNSDGMSKSAEDASQKIVELQSKLESSKAEKSQLDQELIGHKQDRTAAKASLDQAMSVREKERAEFEAATGDQKNDLEALRGALTAIEKGMGSFLQSSSVGVIQRIVGASRTVDEYQKGDLLDLLQGKNPNGDYSSRSGEITGILKAMEDEMDKDLNGAIADEDAAQKGFDELKSSKTAEVSAASEAIESKTVRSGELAVTVTVTADDIEDTTKDMEETQAFLANLGAQCAAKKQEWDERTKMRAEEVAAISKAISILNDDNALDLFKKTLSLSQGSMGFLQMKSASSAVKNARQILAHVTSSHPANLALLQYTLKSKSVDFSKIIAQIDGMMKVLDSDQKNDDDQKDFCDKDLAKNEQIKSDTEDAIAQSTASIEEMTESSDTLASEIAALQNEIKALDKAVAEATEQRKTEHAEFLTFQTENNAALQLVEKAKNALYQFYRPNLHKEEPKKELNEEEKLLVASGAGDMVVSTNAPTMIAGTEQSVYIEVSSKSNEVPPPPPSTWDAYQKKDGKSNGVIGLMDMLIKELQDGITEAEHEESTAQKDYERLMSDSQASRAQSVESITSKEAAKGDLDSNIESTKEKKASQESELANTKQYITQLHAECDFLIESYTLRKSARIQEKEGLANAKSVMSGANFA